MNEYNTMNYEQNDSPVCPYCDHENAQDYDEGVDMLAVCDKCEREFIIEKDVVVSCIYTTFGLNCAVHKLKLLYETKRSKQFYCIECKRKYYDWELPNGEFPKLTEKQFTMED